MPIMTSHIPTAEVLSGPERCRQSGSSTAIAFTLTKLSATAQADKTRQPSVIGGI